MSDFEQAGAPIPRLVDARWLMLALREQARATRKGTWLPYDPIGLLTRAAACIELQIVRPTRASRSKRTAQQAPR